MVDVEVFEDPLVMLLLEVGSGVQGSDQELGVLDASRAVQVDQPHQDHQSLLVRDAFLHYLLEFVAADRAVAVGVRFLEDLFEAELLGVREELGHCVGVNHCFEPVLELSSE